MGPVKPLLVSSAKACKVGFSAFLIPTRFNLLLSIFRRLCWISLRFEALVHQLIERRRLVLGRNGDGVERDNMRVEQGGVGDSVAADGVLQHRFLLQQIGLRRPADPAG